HHVVVAHKFSLGPFKDVATVPVAQLFIGEKFFRTSWKEAAIHPRQRDITLAIGTRKLHVYNRRCGTTVRIVSNVEESLPHGCRAAFHFSRKIDGQNTKGGIHDVTAHVTECARPEIPPASPIEWMIG